MNKPKFTYHNKTTTGTVKVKRDLRAMRMQPK